MRKLTRTQIRLCFYNQINDLEVKYNSLKIEYDEMCSKIKDENANEVL